MPLLVRSLVQQPPPLLFAEPRHLLVGCVLYHYGLTEFKVLR